jgi:hypothetical protein
MPVAIHQPLPRAIKATENAPMAIEDTIKKSKAVVIQSPYEKRGLSFARRH